MHHGEYPQKRIGRPQLGGGGNGGPRSSVSSKAWSGGECTAATAPGCVAVARHHLVCSHVCACLHPVDVRPAAQTASLEGDAAGAGTDGRVNEDAPVTSYDIVHHDANVLDLRDAELDFSRRAQRVRIALVETVRRQYSLSICLCARPDGGDSLILRCRFFLRAALSCGTRHYRSGRCDRCAAIDREGGAIIDDGHHPAVRHVDLHRIRTHVKAVVDAHVRSVDAAVELAGALGAAARGMPKLCLSALRVRYLSLPR